MNKAQLAELKELVGDDMFVGQDSIPFDGLRLYVVLSTKTDLDPNDIALDMRLAGVYASPLPKTSGYPNVYPFAGYVHPLEIISNGRPKQISATPLELAEVIPAEAVFVSKAVLPSEEYPERAQELREAIASVDLERKTGKKVFGAKDPVGPNRWVMLRVNAKPGMRSLRPVDVRNILLKAGYKAFTPSTGLLGLLVPAADWSSSTWTEVLFNPGGQAVTAEQLREAFPAGLIAETDPIGLYDLDFLRDHQEIIDFYFKAQKLEVAATGAGGSLRGALEDILNDLGKVFGATRYLLWGALGVGAAWLGLRAYGALTSAASKAKG